MDIKYWTFSAVVQKILENVKQIDITLLSPNKFFLINSVIPLNYDNVKRNKV